MHTVRYSLLITVLFTTIFHKSVQIPESLQVPESPSISSKNYAISKKNQVDIKPYMAALKWQGRNVLHCGATFISPQYLITTASCLSRNTQFTTEILTGPLNDPSHQQVHKVIKFIPYSKSQTKFPYQPHDIGLIKLENPIQPNDYQKPIPIWEPSDEIVVEDVVEVVSLKRPQNSKDSSNCFYSSSTLQVIDSGVCRRIFSKFYHNMKRTIINEEIMFCGAKGANVESRGEKICEELDGSPAVIDGRLAGIISLVTSCLVGQGVPQVYTRISPYYQWILSNTGNDANYVRDYSVHGEMAQTLDEAFRELDKSHLQ